ncbi:MAG TPA: AtpZ/AtpI family protein [bacterium]|nr:AtpZ/AtpI family protein [bacterium]HPJ71298.1 AtpZ/AtpI family protein [bacterium]HPQ65272.1 AtpZ/AtpI family protein [bacterium]
MNSDWKPIIENFSLVTQVGLVVVICLALGLGLGMVASRLVGLASLCRVAGVVLGLAAGLYQAYRILMEKIG